MVEHIIAGLVGALVFSVPTGFILLVAKARRRSPLPGLLLLVALGVGGCMYFTGGQL